MNLEHSFLRQHGLTVAFAAALLATACGGTFSGTGAAGAGGAGTAGSGAGGSGATAGSGPYCNAACPLIACDGPSTTLPGECCPTCEPSGGGSPGGGSSSGGAGGATCADIVPCADIGCPPGWISELQPGACCPSCVSGGAGAGGCEDVACPGIACAKGYMLQQSAGACCPSCVPNDACTQGQQSYDTLRQQLISQPGAVACKVSNDCALLSGSAYCGDECSAIPVNAAAAPSMDSQLSAYATKNCSTCTPVYPPCAAPPPPSCIDGQCVIGQFLPD
jgi:hypothetical protein